MLNTDQAIVFSILGIALVLFVWNRIRFDLVALIHASKSASTDSIVERLFAFGEQMVNTLGSDNLSRLAEGASDAMEDAVRETADAKPTGGMFSTLSMLSKPESQKSLMFLLSFAANLQKRCCD